MNRVITVSRQETARDRSRGQALVEFTLVAPLLFLLILGTIEAGRFIFLQELMNNSAREGARYAIVHGADSLCPSGPMPGDADFNSLPSSSCDFTGKNIMARVQEAALSMASLGDLFVYSPVWTDQAILARPEPGGSNTGSNERGNYVTVFVDFVYRPLIGEVMDVGFLPDIKISAESTLVINY